MILDSSIRQKLRLAWTLAERDIRQRYARSALGALWLVVWPIALSGLYYFAFGVMAKLEWKDSRIASHLPYFVPLLMGIAYYLWLSDLVSTSTRLFASRAAFLKRSPMPLWVLWLSNFMRSGAGAGAGLVIAIGAVIFAGAVHLGSIWAAPLSLMFFMAFMAGLSLMLAMIGPFFGDIAEAVRIALRVVLYTAPITYPLSLAPPQHAWLLYLNPLTPFVEMFRAAMLYGDLGSPLDVFCAVGWTCFFSLAGTFLYMRANEAVIDVV